MSFYPTRPDGANAEGSAAARALHRVGGGWQKKFSVDASAVRSGDFTRVRGEPYELLTQAWAKADEEGNDHNTRAVMKNRTAIPWVAGALRHFRGANEFFGWGIPSSGVSTHPESYTYPGHGSVTFDVVDYQFQIYIAPWVGEVGIASWGVDASQTLIRPTSSFWWPMPTVRSALVGRASIGDDSGNFSCFTRLRRGSRTDPGGRPLEDPEIILCANGVETAYIVTLPVSGFTHPQAEFLWAPIPIATEKYLWVFLAEAAYFHTEPKTMPRLWMLRISKDGFSSVVPYDVTGEVFPEWMGGSEMIWADPLWGPNVFANGPAYQFSLPRMAALPGDRLLLSTSFVKQVVEDFETRSYSTAKMHLISPSGSISEVAIDTQRKADLMPNGGGLIMEIPNSFVEGIYPIGEGRVIAKICRGTVLPGLRAMRRQEDTWDLPWPYIEDRGFDVEWLRSLDGGLSFSPFTPTGLPASVNQHIGDIMVMEPWDGDKQATLMIACRDQDNGYYAIYQSKDGGASWSRYSILKRGDELLSFASQNEDDPVFMDGLHYPESDAGFNAYRTIWRAPEYAKPVDPTIPDRYKAAQ